MDGDVENGLVMAGQVASAINSLIRISEFVPAMAEDATRILIDFSKSMTVSAAVCGVG
jgi:enoyl-[acyl-carrier protein] reductase II